MFYKNQLTKLLSVVYGTRRLIIVFTSPRKVNSRVQHCLTSNMLLFTVRNISPPDEFTTPHWPSAIPYALHSQLHSIESVGLSFGNLRTHYTFGKWDPHNNALNIIQT
jgi:hypothetical protein